VAIVLTFTAANWDTAQTVTVTAVDDDVDEGAHTSTITHAAASADANYNGMAIGNMIAGLTDNDTAGVTVAESGGTTEVTEGGATDSYTIVLDSEPASNVTITIDPDHQADLGTGADTTINLTFTAANWDTPQTVTVTPIDDNSRQGTHYSGLAHTVLSGDANYAGFTVADVVVEIADDEPPLGGGGAPEVIDEGLPDEPPDDEPLPPEEEPSEPEPPPAPDLRVRIAFSWSSAYVGDELSFIAFVENVGNADALDVEVYVGISENAELISAQIVSVARVQPLSFRITAVDEVAIHVGDVPAGHIVPVESVIRAIDSGMLVVAVGVEQAEVLVSEEFTEVDVDDTYDEIVMVHQPVWPVMPFTPCGAMGILPMLALAALLGWRIPTGAERSSAQRESIS